MVVTRKIKGERECMSVCVGRGDEIENQREQRQGFAKGTNTERSF